MPGGRADYTTVGGFRGVPSGNAQLHLNRKWPNGYSPRTLQANPKISTLRDPFHSTALDTVNLWQGVFGTVTESSSGVLFTNPASYTGYNGFNSIGRFDLTESQISIRLLNGGNQTLASLEVAPIQLIADSTSGNNKLFWYLNGGTLRNYQMVAGTQTALTNSLTYNPAVHVYFRIRETGGTVYFDWSTDGLTWTNLNSVADPFTLSNLVYDPYVGTFSLEASSTTVLMDSLNSAVTAQTLTGNLRGVASPYPQVVLGDKPNIYWRLDETTGTTAYDLLNTTPGLYQGGFTLAQPGGLSTDPDYATAFNGTSGYVQVPHTPALDVGDVFTLECWVNANNFTGTPILITNNTGSYILRLETTGAWTLRQGAVNNVVTSTTTLSTGQWYHLMVTKIGATVHLYQNGVDVTGAVSNLTIQNNTYGLALAAATSGISNVGTAPFFSGTLDEVAIYPYALTQAQAQAHYAAATGVSGVTKSTITSKAGNLVAAGARGVATINTHLTGALQAAASLPRSMATGLTGALQVTGSAVKSTAKTVAGGLIAAGTVAGQHLFNVILTALLQLNATSPKSAQLVAQGTPTVGTAGGALTPSWPAGATRQPGNTLVCWAFLWGHSGTPGMPPAGWTQAQYIGSATFFNSAFILTKVATGGDAAPTLPVSAGATWGACLAEFTPTGPLDRSAGLTNASGSFTITANGADQSAGELVLYADTVSYSVAGTKGVTSSLNNGATDHNTNSGASNTQFHYSFGWGVTTGNSASDAETTSVTGTNLSGISSVIVSVNQVQPFLKLTSHGIGGAMQIAGTLPRSIRHGITGTLTATGAISRSVAHALIANLVATGSVIKTTAHTVTANLVAAGLMTTAAVHHYTQQLAANLVAVGALARGSAHTVIVNANLIASGAVKRSTSKLISAALITSGAVSRRTAKGMAAALVMSGKVSKASARALSGALRATGSLTTGSAHQLVLSAALKATGALTKARQVAQLLSAALRASGAVSRAHTITMLLTGALSASGSMVRRIGKGLSGALGLIGQVAEIMTRMVHRGTTASSATLAYRATGTASAIYVTASGADEYITEGATSLSNQTGSAAQPYDTVGTTA